LLISGPSMFLAWLKLRKRNLGPILDANGWAINTRALLNGPFGAALTERAALPKGARRILADPYANRRRGPKAVLAVLLLLALLWVLWRDGRIDSVLPAGWKRQAPAPGMAQPAGGDAPAP
jgi:hypothetical protein